MLSEWDTVTSFNRFVREAGPLRLDDALAYSRLPPQFTCFEAPTHELVEAEGARIPIELRVPV
jgi:hypothetical protein